MRIWIQFLASLSGLRIWRHRCKLRCRLWMHLGSYVAMSCGVDRSRSPILTLSMGASICCRCSQEKEEASSLWRCYCGSLGAIQGDFLKALVGTWRTEIGTRAAHSHFHLFHGPHFRHTLEHGLPPLILQVPLCPGHSADS